MKQGELALAAAAALAVYLVIKRRKKPKIIDGWRGTAHARLVGRTPLLRLASLSRLSGREIYVKCEQQNPSGTGKDRLALAMLRAAEASGELPAGGGGVVVVEGSSGCTTIGLAPLVLAAGHRLIAVLPDDCAREKRDAISAFPGVEVRVVRAAAISSPTHYVNVARRVAEELRERGERAVFADQFENPSNARAHLETGDELAAQAPGGRVDAFVMGAGTGGTLAGVSAALPSTRVYLADPQGSALHGRVAHGVCYDARQAERAVRRHRYDTIVDGVGLDRVTANFAAARVDGSFSVTDADALVMAHYLLRFEGLFLGSSSGLNCVAALRAARELRPGSVVVTVLCDAGHRYLSRFWNREFVEARGLAWPPADPAELERAVRAMVAPDE